MNNTFMLIGTDKCPNCGVKGKQWKKKPEVFVCPTCSAFYNEFGMVLEPRR